MQGSDGKRELALRRATYERFLRRGLKELSRGRLDDALFWLDAAAAVAWLHPFDEWRSDEIDNALVQIARSLPHEAVEPQPDRLAHQVSMIIDGGGHVELLLLMLENIRGFEQFVVSSEWANNSPQQGKKTLAGLSFPVSLCPRGLSPTGKVEWIYRRLAEIRPGRIILDVQPGDVFSVAACVMYREASGAEFMLLNQGDTCFWVGSTLVDRIIEWRDAGAPMSAQLRGASADRIRVVPSTSRSRHSSDVSREELGVPADATLSVTVGGYYKFKTDGFFHYGETLARVLDEHPAHVHLIVGHGYGEEELKASLPHDRVRWLGRRTDVDALIRVSDFVIDSFPVAGGMIRLDTVREGRPIVAVRHPAWTLGYNTGELPDDYPFVAHSDEDVLRHCRTLIGDEALRHTTGDALGRRYEEKFSQTTYARTLNEVVRGGGETPTNTDRPLNRDGGRFALLMNADPIDPVERVQFLESLTGYTPSPTVPEFFVRLGKRARASVKYRVGV